MTKKIAVVGNSAETLIRFRSSVIQKLSERNLVYALSPSFEEAQRKEIQRLGAIPIEIALNRTGINPIKEFLSILKLSQFLKEESIDIVFSYFLKPVIYTSFAASFAKTKRIVSLIEGMGFFFIEQKNESWKKKIIKTIMTLLLKRSIPLSDKVVFLNNDDYRVVQSVVNKEFPHFVLGGIGVDLNHFSPNIKSGKADKVIFITVARILKEKGIFEFIEAAKMIKNVNAEFWIVGGLDTNPGGISESALNRLITIKNLKWFGQTDDVRKFLNEADVFVLPSYREGLPRSTQEAMAMGKAVITTDVEGCRDTVQSGVNGLLVEARSSKALFEAFQYYLNNPSDIEKHGINSRKIAEESYDANRQDEKLVRIVLELD